MLLQVHHLPTKKMEAVVFLEEILVMLLNNAIFLPNQFASVFNISQLCQLNLVLSS